MDKSTIIISVAILIVCVGIGYFLYKKSVKTIPFSGTERPKINIKDNLQNVQLDLTKFNQ